MYNWFPTTRGTTHILLEQGRDTQDVISSFTFLFVVTSVTLVTL